MQEVALVHSGLVENVRKVSVPHAGDQTLITGLLGVRQKQEHRGPREIRLCARNTFGSVLLCANKMKTPICPFIS